MASSSQLGRADWGCWKVRKTLENLEDVGGKVDVDGKENVGIHTRWAPTSHTITACYNML